MERTVSLQIVDYVVVALTLSISLGIGILFAVKDFRNVNRTEYLLGGRRMFMLPVALSIFATYTSGIALVGMVTDIYMNGFMAAALYLGVALGYLVAAFTIVPLLYPLRLTSLYEYLQLRYHSNSLRMFVVLVGMLQTLCYMAIALLSPALALQAGASLPMWVSVGIVGVIGTVYTAIGGIKSVVWTDVFQGLVMVGGLFTIIIKGSLIVGGGGEVWRISRAGGRADFTNFNLDPRVLDTWWGSSIGTTFFWLGTICSQSSSQRISAMKSMTEARNAFLLNGAVIAMFGGLMVTVGWVMYAYFTHVRCDPFYVSCTVASAVPIECLVVLSLTAIIADTAELHTLCDAFSWQQPLCKESADDVVIKPAAMKSGLISNANQLPPYFVMHALADLPGMGGLYFSMVFSGSLSSISSGISSLAANTVEDLLKTPLKNIQESTVTFITKVFVCWYGALIIGLAFGASYLKGPITNMMIGSVGACAGPILGIFLLGALVPWSNKYGAIGGGVIALVINAWITLGNLMYGPYANLLPPPTSDMCLRNSSLSDVAVVNVSMTYFNNETLYSRAINQTLVSQSVKQDRFSFFLYDISVDWFGFIGTVVCLVFGLAISYCTRKRFTKVTETKLLFPFVRRICLSKQFNDIGDRYDTEGNCKLMVYKPATTCNSNHDVDNSKHAIL